MANTQAADADASATQSAAADEHREAAAEHDAKAEDTD
jgi:hypothetical protein